MLLGGSGIFIDNFRASQGDAIVWVHGQGNVFLVELDAGEQIDVEPGGWLYKDTSVKLESVLDRAQDGLHGRRHKLTWNRFTGPASSRSRRCTSTRSSPRPAPAPMWAPRRAAVWRAR
jgi:uncharacterized protein (AIM24 family)